MSKHTIYAWKAKFGGMEAMQSAEATDPGRLEQPVETVGSEPESGSGEVEGCDRKKRTELVDRRTDACHYR